jgi:hypothetical protein
MTGIASIAARRRLTDESPDDDGEKLWRVLLLVAAAATILMIRPTVFFWEHLPKLSFVQFPWRWMAILAVPYACFLAGAVTRRRTGWIWAVMALSVTGGTAMFLVQRAWWDSEDIPTLREAIARDQGFEGVDEYDPLGDDHNNLSEKAPRVEILPAQESDGSTPNAQVRVVRWSTEERELRVTSDEPVRVALRLLDYPAWRVEVNGREIAQERADDYDQMIVPLGAGESGVWVRYTRTRDRTLGGVITAASLLAAMFLMQRPPHK